MAKPAIRGALRCANDSPPRQRSQRIHEHGPKMAAAARAAAWSGEGDVLLAQGTERMRLPVAAK